MDVTLYMRPHGHTKVIDCANVRSEDEQFFKERGIKLSMEDLGTEFVVYADIGKTTEDGEPDELVELSAGRTCEDTLFSLRQQCEEALS